MSGRNPFDDVGKPRGATPPSFQRAQAEVKQKVNETTVKAHEAPPQVLPDLITGENYHRLVPQSLDQVQQDLLDDRRFATVTRQSIKDLPTHQERLRAAKALCRREPLGCDALAESMAEDITQKVNSRKIKSNATAAIWCFTGFCFIASTLMSGNPLVGFAVAVIMHFSIGAVLYVVSEVKGMSSVSGKAV
jgi:hypothetical protein